MICLITHNTTYNYIYVYQYDNNNFRQLIVNSSQEDPYKYQLTSILRFSYVHNDIKTNKQILYVGYETSYNNNPNMGSVFLLGFLLEEYADTTYYKRDVNNNTVSLNYNDLSLVFYTIY